MAGKIDIDAGVHYSDEDLEDAGIPDHIQKWMPEDEPWEDPNLVAQLEDDLPQVDSLYPSQFTEFAFRMPVKGRYENFSFEGRRHMRRIYNSPSKRILLCTGRQVEKSTLLGNRILCYCCLIPGYRFLYVSSSSTQAKTFSVDRVKEPIETSPVLTNFTTKMLSQNVFEKQFVNRSKITIRYAFLNADRCRGISAWGLCLDEIQDINLDNIPVIEQATSHGPEEHRYFLYAGTPKTLDNTIEAYRAKYSTMGEWVVPCHRHGGDTGRYWNILGEKNIGKKGLVCEKCHKLINPQDPDADWAWQAKFDPEKRPFESYRIPQLMVPWRPWTEILLDYDRYDRGKFYNEVLGISYDSGTRPLRQIDLINACVPEVSVNDREQLRRIQALSHTQDVFAGIDWGTGTAAYTILVLGMYVENKFRMVYAHRFVGEDSDPEIQVQKIIAILKAFNIRIAGVDHGFGFTQNSQLTKKFGPKRVQQFQYVGRAKRKVQYDAPLNRWKVHRTEVMSDIFTAIKAMKFQFPKWEEFQEPFASDMLAIFSEYNEAQHSIQYGHSPGTTDDTFHAWLYCVLASMIIHPRPDILRPRKEAAHTGTVIDENEWSPMDQG